MKTNVFLLIKTQLWTILRAKTLSAHGRNFALLAPYKIHYRTYCLWMRTALMDISWLSTILKSQVLCPWTWTPILIERWMPSRITRINERLWPISPSAPPWIWCILFRLFAAFIFQAGSSKCYAAHLTVLGDSRAYWRAPWVYWSCIMRRYRQRVSCYETRVIQPVIEAPAYIWVEKFPGAGYRCRSTGTPLYLPVYPIWAVDISIRKRRPQLWLAAAGTSTGIAMDGPKRTPYITWRTGWRFWCHKFLAKGVKTIVNQWRRPLKRKTTWVRLFRHGWTGPRTAEPRQSIYSQPGSTAGFKHFWHPL